MKKIIESLKKVKDFYKAHKKVAIPLTVMVIMLLISLDTMSFNNNKPKEVTYNEFKKLVKEHKVDTVYYEASTEEMRFTLYNKHTKGKTKKEIEDEKYTYPKEDWRLTQYPAGETFREDMLKAGVNLEVRTFEPVTVKVLSTLLTLFFPILFLVLLWNIFSLQFVRGGKSYELTTNIDTRFSDVIGHDEVIKDLKFLVKLMREPEKYDDEDVNIPRGVLFSGEPGTGKTLLARAIAGESNVPFYYVNASNFIELYVGTGAKRVRALFKQARKTQPCIIFIDEIDAIGCQRGKVHGTSEDTQTLNALLQEMDGFDKDLKILIIGATNNAERLDKALVRSGRFDRQIIISPPANADERVDLLKYFLRNKKLDESVDLEVLSKQMIGYTGADINSVVNEAELIRLSNEQEFITMDALEEAFDKKIMKGNRKKDARRDRDLKIVAYHEAGHAVVSYLLDMEIARATIIQTTSGIGGAVIHQESDNLLKTKEDYENRVKVCYGGRASEEIKFSQITTGASSDITQATRVLDEYINRLGFDKEFGLIDMSVLNEDKVTVEDKSVETIKGYSVKLYKDTVELLKNNYNLVELIAKELLDKETISGVTIKEILDSNK